MTSLDLPEISSPTFSVASSLSGSTIRVRFAPLAAGPSSGQVVIFSNDPDEPQVTVPLSDMALACLGHMGQIAEVLTGGDRPRYGNALFGAFGRDFATADGQRVMVVAITGRQWTGLVQSLDLQAPVADLETSLGATFTADEGQRFIHRERLFPLFERAIGALPLDARARSGSVRGQGSTE